MWSDGHRAYLESRVLSADPIELVRMLYQAAMDAVREARKHLEGGEIRERAAAISKSSEVLFELLKALDFDRGGEYAGRLAQLYNYMLRRLNDANFKQDDAPLAEVLGLLTTLAEGWAAIQPTTEAQPAEPESPWTRAPFSQDPATPSQSWSL
jgi:flagellar secretion chaperone FliS